MGTKTEIFPAVPRGAKVAKMIDIGSKPDVSRRAVASGSVLLRKETIRRILSHEVEKGDVLAAAEVAALHAMKQVSHVLPHCHPIPLTYARVDFKAKADRIEVTAEVAATYKTGVEMEALYGATVGLLTVWDMVKSLEKDRDGQYPTARIQDVRVVVKEKGRPRRVRAQRRRRGP